MEAGLLAGSVEDMVESAEDGEVDTGSNGVGGGQSEGCWQSWFERDERELSGKGMHSAALHRTSGEDCAAAEDAVGIDGFGGYSGSAIDNDDGLVVEMEGRGGVGDAVGAEGAGIVG